MKTLWTKVHKSFKRKKNIVFASAVDATHGSVRSFGLHHKRINSNPKQREDRRQQNRPNHHNGWCSVLSSHQTFEEWVEMNNHPKWEEEFTKQRSPRLISIVDGIRDTCNDANNVYDEDCCWRDKQSRPFERVKFSKVIVICCLWCDCEVCVNACQDFEETLDNSKEMSWDSSNNPELLVSPPFLDAHSTPSQFQDSRCNDRPEQCYEEETSKGAYLKEKKR